MSTTEGKMIFEQDFFDIIEIFENKRKEQLEREIEAMMEERNTMRLDQQKKQEIEKIQNDLNNKSDWMMIERSTATNSEEDYTIQMPIQQPAISQNTSQSAAASNTTQRDILGNYAEVVQIGP